jgi:hypothetical protein
MIFGVGINRLPPCTTMEGFPYRKPGLCGERVDAQRLLHRSQDAGFGFWIAVIHFGREIVEKDQWNLAGGRSAGARSAYGPSRRIVFGRFRASLSTSSSHLLPGFHDLFSDNVMHRVFSNQPRFVDFDFSAVRPPPENGQARIVGSHAERIDRTCAGSLHLASN